MRYLDGDRSAPASQAVVIGERTVDVPCSDWIVWQPDRVQIFCLLDLALGVIFVFNALGDLSNWFEMRRRTHRMR